jgi:hypothetical protein
VDPEMPVLLVAEMVEEDVQLGALHNEIFHRHASFFRSTKCWNWNGIIG